MKSIIFGHTVQNLPIPAYTFGASGPSVLILGGVHGDETEGVVAAHGLLSSFASSFTYRLKVTLVPALNLDGVLRMSRKNSHEIDLNRNLPTGDWTAEVANDRYNPGVRAGSEPENKALIEYLDTARPKFVLSLHSWQPMLNVNGDCRPEAEVISRFTGYRIEESIGYPTPGCLGTYAGLERDMPTLTYEIERGSEPNQVLSLHIPAILEGLKVTEERYAHE